MSKEQTNYDVLTQIESLKIFSNQCKASITSVNDDVQSAKGSLVTTYVSYRYRMETIYRSFNNGLRTAFSYTQATDFIHEIITYTNTITITLR